MNTRTCTYTPATIRLADRLNADDGNYRAVGPSVKAVGSGPAGLEEGEWDLLMALGENFIATDHGDGIPCEIVEISENETATGSEWPCVRVEPSCESDIAFEFCIYPEFLDKAI